MELAALYLIHPPALYRILDFIGSPIRNCEKNSRVAFPSGPDGQRIFLQ